MKGTKLRLVGILLLSGFLRFYRIEDLAGFDFDQELAVQVGQRILNGKLTLIGQETSVPGIFVGPWYNYNVAFLLFLSKGNPIIIFYFQILLGILTTYFLFLIGKRYSYSLGILVSFIYAVSDRFIQIDQSSTPSNGIIFLTVLALWVVLNPRFTSFLKQLITSSIAGFATQMHPSGLALAFFPVFLFLKTKRLRFGPKLLSLAAFFFWFFPLILFDLRHQFLNLQGLMSLGDSSYYPLLFRALIVTRIALSSWLRILLPFPASPLLISFFIFFLFFILRYGKDRQYQVLLLFSSPLLFLFYPAPIPEYYFFPSFVGFLFIFSFFVSAVLGSSPLKKFLLYFLLICLFALNSFVHLTAENPFSLNNKKRAVEFIKSKSQGAPIRLNIDADYGQATGFEYLLDWAGVKYVLTGENPDFVLYIPQARAARGTTFGGIRVEKVSSSL